MKIETTSADRPKPSVPRQEKHEQFLLQRWRAPEPSINRPRCGGDAAVERSMLPAEFDKETEI